MRRLMVSAFVGVALAAAAVSMADAKTFKYAYAGDVRSLDPHSLTESFSISFLNSIYEGLVRYNDKLEVEPALATSWEVKAPDVMRYHLREGVKFHDGAEFDADDVVMSLTRATHPDSPIRGNLPALKSVTKVDKYTVDLNLTGPSPLLNNFLTNMQIMDSGWLEKNNAVHPVDSDKAQESYATTHTNGTGPFMLESRRPDAKTVLVVNPNWWDKPKHNLTRVEFSPITSDATRVAALLSGELDMIYPAPLQDVARINGTAKMKVLEGPELRLIMLQFNLKDKLNDSDVSGNPFKDVKVRKAFYQSINMDLVKQKIMRGKSRNAGLLVAPEVPGYSAKEDVRFPYDPEAAKVLLKDAGYPNGFTFAMNCPNDRYVNDEETCQAIASMAAKVGLKAKLTTETKNIHFQKTKANKSDVYMLGWATLPMLDTFSVMSALLATPDGGAYGTWNPGGYSNARIDELTKAVATELDEGKRRAMMTEALVIARDEVAILPLHLQPLSWAVRDGVHVVQAPDDKLRVWYTTID